MAMQNYKKIFSQEKKWLCISLCAVFLWGLVAHGYCFLQDSFNHDSLAEFNGLVFGNQIKFAAGRFLVPLYRNVFRTDLTLPWLIGVLALLWLGLAVFFVLKIFDIRSPILVFLIAGVFTVNTAITATAASYLHDFDSDCFAILSAVMAVYLWRKVPWGSLIGAFFVVGPLGIYQSNISVTIVLVMLVCILDLLNGEDFRRVFRNGIKALGMLLLGVVLYCVALQIVIAVTGHGLATGNDNTLDRMRELSLSNVFSYIAGAYRDCWRRLTFAISPYSGSMVRGATMGLAGIIMISLFVFLLKKGIPLTSKLLCICLVALLPMGMNITYVLSAGAVHDLMAFSIWLFYLQALLFAYWLVRDLGACQLKWIPKFICKLPGLVAMALVFVLVYGNVQVANTLYLKKDLEKDAYLSLMTRVVYDMERVEGYVPGETPVVFVGQSDQIQTVPGTEQCEDIIGAWAPGPVILRDQCYYAAYFSYILANPAVMAENPVWYPLLSDPRVAIMPVYPNEGYLDFVDGVLVVRLG